MSTAPVLHWLPQDDDWRNRLKQFRSLEAASTENWDQAVRLANARLDFAMTNALDASLSRLFGDTPPAWLATKPVRLAILGSSTTTHLHPAIRMAGLRRGIWITTYENNYGQYWQELLDPESDLHRFRPDMVLFSLDSHHIVEGIEPILGVAEASELHEAAMRKLRDCWRMAREELRCVVIQQSFLDVFPMLLGNNEHRLPGSRSAAIATMNRGIRAAAEEDGVDILALDQRQLIDGTAAWFNTALWHRSKQEISPTAAPVYGDLVARMAAARQGRSFKCLVLDLDNTLWGGVIGDDGLDGIQLGQGSATGEAFVDLQTYARQLSQRGIILAVCSKNDMANAVEPFDQHPEMILRRTDIASFVANWDDKATNIRRIAEELNIGLDAIVFLDDNPFERALVRRELPMVAVPEVPDEPALMAYSLSDAGYFESMRLTDDDMQRSRQYQGNSQRGALLSAATDLDSYLRALEMKLIWRPFDRIGLQRIVQLVNKTNQFNLTTRRYTEDDILAVMEDDRAIGLQIRLTDRFGDNGIIAIVIGRLDDRSDMVIDTWLMSCRVLGRKVEEATLDLLVAEGKKLGATSFTGAYIPTKKNGMVRDHYTKLGFAPKAPCDEASYQFVLSLADYDPTILFMEIEEDQS